MKTTLKTLLSSLLLAAAAGPASAGPDFVGEAHPHKPLAASETNKPMLPEDDIAFPHDSAALMDSSLQQIDAVARWLRAHPRHKIVLEGHADSSGSTVYNDDLAQRRGEMVRAQLIGRGVSRDRILVLVYGEAAAKPKPSPIDRRVVLFATTESLEVVARRALAQQRALHAIWNRNDVQFTETRATEALPVVTVASR